MKFEVGKKYIDRGKEVRLVIFVDDKSIVTEHVSYPAYGRALWPVSLHIDDWKEYREPRVTKKDVVLLRLTETGFNVLALSGPDARSVVVLDHGEKYTNSWYEEVSRKTVEFTED